MVYFWYKKDDFALTRVSFSRRNINDNALIFITQKNSALKTKNIL